MANHEETAIHNLKEVLPDISGDSIVTASFQAAVEIGHLRTEVERLKADLTANAAMLARQCDLAREAESKEMEARAEVERLTKERNSLREQMRAVVAGLDTAFGKQ